GKAGGKPLMWKTGHSLIKAKMAETGSPLAGEMSGHIFFADKWYGFDDALYAGVRTLGIVARMDGPLSAVRKALPQVINTPEL
ncbi:MAG: phosphomannomutase, partial [Acidocella sp.]|nr:phosphomannomutase [Acidocella sp.]